MWRSEQQTNDAIFLLLDLCGLPALRGLWTREGPTERACDLYAANGGYLSSGERRMLLAAFDLANRVRDGDLQRIGLSDVVIMDTPRARLVLSLALAMATGLAAIDEWIAERLRAFDAETAVQVARLHADAARVEALRSEASRTGNIALVALCDRALAGDEGAWSAALACLCPSACPVHRPPPPPELCPRCGTRTADHCWKEPEGWTWDCEGGCNP